MRAQTLEMVRVTNVTILGVATSRARDADASSVIGRKIMSLARADCPSIATHIRHRFSLSAAGPNWTRIMHSTTPDTDTLVRAQTRLATRAAHPHPRYATPL